MSKEEFLVYLDSYIEMWRTARDNAQSEALRQGIEEETEEVFMSRCYIDAYQHVRDTLYGTILKAGKTP